MSDYADFKHFFAIALTLSVLPPVASQANLIGNGDFELGPTGFSTDYTLSIELSDQGTFLVGSSVPNGWADGFQDHGLGVGFMAMFNASTNSSDRIWSQSLPVVAGRSYRLEGWVAALTESIRPDTAPILELRIGGTVVGTFPAALLDDVWQRFEFQWTAPQTEVVAFELRDLRALFSGDDFALDDLSLSACGGAFENALCDSLVVVQSGGGELVVEARFNDSLNLTEVLALSQDYSLRTNGKDEPFDHFNWLQIGVSDNFGFSSMPFVDPRPGGNDNQISQCGVSPARDLLPWYWDEERGGLDLCTPPGSNQETQALANNFGQAVSFEDRPNLLVPGRSVTFNLVLVGVYSDGTGKALTDIPGVQLNWTYTQTTLFGDGQITISNQNTDPALAGGGDVDSRVLDESELTEGFDVLIQQTINDATPPALPTAGTWIRVALAMILIGAGAWSLRLHASQNQKREPRAEIG